MSDEHKAKTADMIAVMQAYVDGKPIEHAFRSRNSEMMGWFSLGEPSWHWADCDYRIATIPDSINWDHVSPEWKYMARDNGGVAYFYSSKPEIYGTRWTNSAGAHEANGFASYVRGTVDWKDSLVKRPD